VPVLPGTAERYDSAGKQWAAAGTMAQGRVAHSATLLADGMVLVVGGQAEDSGGVYLGSTEEYDPASNNWVQRAPLTRARAGHTATRLSSGQVLVVGGQDASGCLSSVERYDPASKSWIDSR
jgi:N-acetylneuraminic acid mutarotase